jgi:uncharacterized protein YrzB (UPF0473 family)
MSSGEEEEVESFEDAERFVLTDDEGNEETYVVMAIAEIDGKDYALLAAEDDLESPSEEMAVFVFEYRRDDDGVVDLVDIEDEAKQEEVYNHFAELMDLEESEDSEESEA